MSYNACDKEEGFTPERKAILARRFKTTLCKKYAETGRCPYALRCMFAHGERDLRTPEQNLRDGLTSNAEIREHQQKLQEAARERQRTKELANRQRPDQSRGPVQQAVPPPVVQTCEADGDDRSAVVSASASLTSEPPRRSILFPRASPPTSEYAVDTPRMSEPDSDTTTNTATPSAVRVEYDRAVYVSPLAAAMLSSHVTVTAGEDQRISACRGSSGLASILVVRLS